MSNESKGFSNIFGGIKFLGGLFATNSILGCVFTALLLAVWIWYAISKKGMEWKEAVKKAGDSLKAVGGESIAHNDNTTSGDDWETGESDGTEQEGNSDSSGS